MLNKCSTSSMCRSCVTSPKLITHGRAIVRVHNHVQQYRLQLPNSVRFTGSTSTTRWRAAHRRIVPSALGTDDASDSSALKVVSLPPDNYNESLLKLSLLVALIVAGSYTLHPSLLIWTSEIWNLSGQGSDVGTFETSFFSFVSIVYAIMIGNTFTFLYARQERIVADLYAEVFAVEILLQEICLSMNDPAARVPLITYLREYVMEELYNPLEMQSPFQSGSPFLKVITAVRRCRAVGEDAGGMMRACEALADAQSKRSASASQILPSVHWLFIYTVLLILVWTSLVFEASSGPQLESRRLIFSAECGLLSITVQLLQDLAQPLDGLYTFRGALDERLSYVTQELDAYLSRHGIATMDEEDPDLCTIQPTAGEREAELVAANTGMNGAQR